MKHLIPPHRRRRMAGASLVELMIVVGIIGAIAGMAVANMPRLGRDMRIGRAAHTYAALLREARGRALANRAFIRVQSNASSEMRMDERNCRFGIRDQSAAPGGACSAWTAVRIYKLTSEDFRHVNVPAQTVIFNPRGGLESPSGGGAIQFSSTFPGVTIKQKVRVSAEGWVEKL